MTPQARRLLAAARAVGRRRTLRFLGWAAELNPRASRHAAQELEQLGLLDRCNEREVRPHATTLFKAPE